MEWTPVKPELGETDRRLAELILHVSRMCEGDETFGATKLNKILFVADFLAFRMLGTSITGAEYQKLSHGPAPRRLLPVLEWLQEAGDLAVRVERRFGYEQKRPVALRDPDLSRFSAEQISLVDRVVQQLWGRTATEVSRWSHGFVGWQLADEGETIPYTLALLAEDRELSEEGRKVAEELDQYAAALLAGDAR